MKAVLSDIHFGDKKNCDLLRHAWVQDILFEAIKDCDELLFLGDVWEFTFCSYFASVKASESFFRRLGEKFPKMKITVTVGNHDHHLVLRSKDEEQEQKALFNQACIENSLPPVERILKAFMPKNPIETFYPCKSENGIWYHHGHYISSHLDVIGWQMLDRLQWKILGQKRDKDAKLGIPEYEALIAPLHEFSYQVAQLPKGSDSQIQLVSQFKKIGDVFKSTPSLKHSLTKPSKKQIVDEALLATEMLKEEVEKNGRMSRNHVLDIEAIKKVLSNLDVNDKKIVFAHTHRANSGEDVFSGGKKWTVYNSGNWLFDKKTLSNKKNKNSLPGSILFVDEKADIKMKNLLSIEQIEQFSKYYQEAHNE